MLTAIRTKHPGFGNLIGLEAQRQLEMAGKPENLAYDEGELAMGLAVLPSVT